LILVVLRIQVERDGLIADLEVLEQASQVLQQELREVTQRLSMKSNELEAAVLRIPYSSSPLLPSSPLKEIPVDN
jgi:hypothetical protein